MRVSGERSRTASIHAAKCAAPPSRRSSRSTLVITTCFNASSATVCARCPGSSASGGSGRPCATSQNGQRRVQRSPRIMNVAVPLPKHSPIFGHEASSHTVCSRCSRSTRFMSRNRGACDNRTRIQSGFASIDAGLISITRRPGRGAVLASPRWPRDVAACAINRSSIAFLVARRPPLRPTPSC